MISPSLEPDTLSHHKRYGNALFNKKVNDLASFFTFNTE